MPPSPYSSEDVEFDDGNESELAAHGIASSEVLQVINNDPVWAPNKKGRSGMWLCVGRTNGGRALSIPVKYDEIRMVIRPITGWDCSPGERTRYLGG